MAPHFPGRHHNTCVGDPLSLRANQSGSRFPPPPPPLKGKPKGWPGLFQLARRVGAHGHWRLSGARLREPEAQGGERSRSRGSRTQKLKRDGFAILCVFLGGCLFFVTLLLSFFWCVCVCLHLFCAFGGVLWRFSAFILCLCVCVLCVL